jgi:hypothetical protein
VEALGRRVILSLVIIAMTISGCASSPRALSPDADRGGPLSVATKGSIVTPDFSLRYSISKRARSPALIGSERATGDVVSEMEVPQGVSPRVTSADGSAVALTDGETGEGLYEFVARDRTRVIVARPAADTWRSYVLDGNFGPEAFSTDTRKLFLIEYLDDEGLRYRVRMMRLSTGRVLPVGRLTKFAPPSMRGTGRVQVYAPDYDVLYTLYTRQPPNYAHQDEGEVHDRGMVHAFVHVLDLRQGWAHCVDLAMPFGMDTAPASDLEVSPDGARLYAGDGKRVAIVDTKRLRTIRVRPVTSLPAITSE